MFGPDGEDEGQAGELSPRAAEIDFEGEAGAERINDFVADEKDGVEAGEVGGTGLERFDGERASIEFAPENGGERDGGVRIGVGVEVFDAVGRRLRENANGHGFAVGADAGVGDGSPATVGAEEIDDGYESGIDAAVVEEGSEARGDIEAQMDVVAVGESRDEGF